MNIFYFFSLSQHKFKLKSFALETVVSSPHLVFASFFLLFLSLACSMYVSLLESCQRVLQDLNSLKMLIKTYGK